MTLRWLPMLACVGLVACAVYDDQLLEPRAGTSGQSTGGRSGGGGGDPCVPSEELCNEKDDDCNGVIDDELPANNDCSTRYHATVRCGRAGFCVFVPSEPMCYPGYYHCDGDPANGCESDTRCCEPMCEDDAGSEDAGDDDGG